MNKLNLLVLGAFVVAGFTLSTAVSAEAPATSSATAQKDEYTDIAGKATSVEAERKSNNEGLAVSLALATLIIGGILIIASKTESQLDEDSD